VFKQITYTVLVETLNTAQSINQSPDANCHILSVNRDFKSLG